MVVQHLTLIEYDPREDQNARKVEPQEEVVRARVARADHERKDYLALKRSHTYYSKPRAKHHEAAIVSQNLMLSEASLDHESIQKSARSARNMKISARPSITMPVNDIAVNFTLTNLIGGSYFEYVPQLCLRTSAQGILYRTLNCIALANFASCTRQDGLLFMARSLHQEVLRYIRVALDDIATACLDETLAAVLLVAYFGFVDGSSAHETAMGREQHLRGAISILQMRSAKGISSDIGDQMVLQTWDSILLQSHRKRERVPDDINMLLQKRCLSEAGIKTWEIQSTKPANKWSRSVAEFRAAIYDGILTDPMGIIEEALSLFPRADEVYFEMQDIWPYTICTTDANKEGVFQGIYHVYPNGESAWMFYGLYRISTIWLHTIVIDHCQKLLNQHTQDLESYTSLSLNELIRHSRSEIERVAADICACVPQHLDPTFVRNKYRQIWIRRAYKQSRFRTCPGAIKFMSPGKEELPFQQSEQGHHMSSACSLIWPLYVAGGATTSESLRNYTMDRLRYIGSSRNIHMATVAASRLANGDYQNEDGLDMAYSI